METYVPSKEDNPFVDNIVRNMADDMFYCKFIRERFSITGPTMGRSIYAPGRNQILYLYGYADFIGEHKLIPLLGQVIQNMFGPSSYIKQTYYYLTPLIYKNCIITHELTGANQLYGLEDFVGYNGKKPTTHLLKRKDAYGRDLDYIQINMDDPYGDKFLVFPSKVYEMYEIFDFIPNETTNVYHVPNIGDVILDKPQGDIIWYNEQVRIIFEKGFIPPEIKTNHDELPFNTYAAVGEELTNRD